jgi:dihydrofolate synthase/folylpolyglutamate synthase
LESIAFEKAGIIKANTPAIISQSNSDLQSIFLEKGNVTNSNVIFPSDTDTITFQNYKDNLSMVLDIKIDDVDLKEIQVELSGNHQFDNIISAIKALNSIKYHYNITEENIIDGLKNIRSNTGLFGRIQKISDKPPIILDAAHNPGAIKMLAETMLQSQYDKTKFDIVFGAMADKNIEEMLVYLFPICNTLIITRPEISRASDTEIIESLARKLCFSKIIVFDNVSDSLNYAIGMQNPLIITGSFYLLGDFIATLRESNKIDL